MSRAEEITSTEEYGCGLEGVLRSRKNDLVGILNGIDMDAWDPSKDDLIPYRFSPLDLAGKSGDRGELLKVFGLPQRGERLVARLLQHVADDGVFRVVQRD